MTIFRRTSMCSVSPMCCKAGSKRSELHKGRLRLPEHLLLGLKACHLLRQGQKLKVEHQCRHENTQLQICQPLAKTAPEPAAEPKRRQRICVKHFFTRGIIRGQPPSRLKQVQVLAARAVEPATRAFELSCLRC